MANLSGTPSRVTPETVEKAMTALFKWRDSKSKTQKPQLLEQDEFVYLVLTLKKIPAKTQIKPIKIPLPHPLYNPPNDNTELCLIIDDSSKSHLTKDAVKRKIEEEKIPVSKILKLSKLKSDYRPFEAKRKLCDSYDLFFADRRVIPLLPRLLGKQFFRKRKIPVAVDLVHKNWKEQVEKACGSGMLYLRTGTCCVVKVGRVSMGRKEILENVVAAIDGVGEVVPRKWENVRSLHLKLLESLALPVYQAVPDVKFRIDSGVKEGEIAAAEEVVLEKVWNKEKMNKKKKKGRISEIRYMDQEILAGVSDDEVSDVEIGVGGGEEIGGKKRKKVGDVKVVKKLAKVKKEDGIKPKKVKVAK